MNKRTQHMQRRKEHGLTYRALAQEFNTSKSTAHRRLRPKEVPPKPNGAPTPLGDVMRQGFIPQPILENKN